MPHMNQEPTAPIAPNLDVLRSEIDRIDDALLELVEQRLAASLAIAARKDADGDGLLKLRPRREAAVIARLVSRARTASPELVTQMWRGLMAHGLQAQLRTELVLCTSGDRAALQERVRARFGAAAPIHWADAPADAIAAAREREAVAIIERSLPIALEEDDNLIMFDALHNEDGSLLAVAIGRVAPEDAILWEVGQ